MPKSERAGSTNQCNQLDEGLEAKHIENVPSSSLSDGNGTINGFTLNTKVGSKSESNSKDSDLDMHSNETKTSKVPKLPLFQKAILVIGNCLQATLPFGFIVVLGMLFVDIIDEFNSTRAEAFPIMSVYTGLMFGSGAFWGPLLNRYNAGIIWMIGTCGILIGCIMCFFATSIVILVIAQALTGIGMSLNFIVPFTVVGEMFEERRLTMVTVVGVFSTVGKIYFPYLTSYLKDEFGWRGTFLILGAVFLNSVPVGIQVMIFKKRRKGLLGPQQTNFRSFFNLHLCKKPAFLVFAYNSFFVNTFFTALDMFFLDMLRSRHFDVRDGPFLLSVNGFANLSGRVFFTVISPFLRCQRMTVLPLSLLLCSSIVLSFTFFETYTQLLAICILFGLFWGSCTVLYPAIVMEISGLKLYATALGYINFTSGMAGLIGGPLIGSVKDATKSYDTVYYIATGLGLLSCTLTSMVVLSRKYQERRKVKDPESEGSKTLMTKFH